MKTIEQVVFDKYKSDQSLPKRKRMAPEDYIDWANFGAKEAQRWISVEEELPELNRDLYSDLLLLKDEKGKLHIGFYHWTMKGNIFITNNGLSFYEAYITHFRPINRK